ncbi:hypothetical protein KFE25_014108 [Diacronema lutheri]|uniref:Bifunctional lysine-specific demethylase and histidyl-hydroxylase n=2 Tax=Diacronema lutheri TaxID=2081491 RepID=A0A8J6C9B2_DIALT|nr:hypothetical protein KFE25_014108 [Diacronema lutheri]
MGGEEGVEDDDGAPRYARFPPPADAEALRLLLWPLEPRAFFAAHYAQAALAAAPTSVRGFAARRAYGGAPGCERALAALLRAVHALHAWRLGSVEGRRRGADARVPSTYGALRDELDAGRSFVAHVPSVHELRSATRAGARGALLALAPAAEVRHRLERALRMPLTANLYISGTSSVALAPHTDTTDTVALQLEGSKHWRVCVPVLPAELEHSVRAAAPRAPPPSDAERAEVLEAAMASERGCTAHTEGALADHRRFSCAEHVLQPGALLWIPKGIVHAAQEHGSALNVSVHLTLGLRAYGLRFADLLARALDEPTVAERAARLAGEHARVTAEGGGAPGEGNASEGDGSAEDAARGAELLNAALAGASGGVAGVAWRRPLPTWLFACDDAPTARDGTHIEAPLNVGALDVSAHNASAWSLCAPTAGSRARRALARVYNGHARALAAAAAEQLVPSTAGGAGARAAAERALREALTADAALDHALRATVTALGALLEAGHALRDRLDALDYDASLTREADPTKAFAARGGGAKLGVALVGAVACAVFTIGALLMLDVALTRTARRRRAPPVAAVPIVTTAATSCDSPRTQPDAVRSQTS